MEENVESKGTATDKTRLLSCVCAADGGGGGGGGGDILMGSVY